MSYWVWKLQIFKNCFFIENGVIGMAAFFIGTFLGVGVSGVLVQIINHIFEMPHAYRISFFHKGFCNSFYIFYVYVRYRNTTCSKGDPQT